MILMVAFLMVAAMWGKVLFSLCEVFILFLMVAIPLYVVGGFLLYAIGVVT